MTGVRIDPELQSLIPPPKPDELRLLEEALLQEGCRDALVVWAGKGILLDGHNRLAICRRHGIPYRTTSIALPDRTAAADWIDRNQLARRNLTPADCRLLIGRRYNRMRQAHGGDRKSSVQNAHLNEDTKSSAVHIGDEYGINERTVRRAGRLAGAVETVKPNVPDIEERYRSGDLTASAIVEAAKNPATAAEKLNSPHVSRNLTDDQRAINAAAIKDLLSEQAKEERARSAGKAGGRGRRSKNSLSETCADKRSEPKRDTREDTAKQQGVSERKLREVDTRGQLKGRDMSGGAIALPPEGGAPTLAELGLTKCESAAAQRHDMLARRRIEGSTAGGTNPYDRYSESCLEETCASKQKSRSRTRVAKRQLASERRSRRASRPGKPHWEPTSRPQARSV